MAAPGNGWRRDVTAHLDCAGAGIERELEPAKRKVGIHACLGVYGRRRRLTKQQHLQASVLLELEPVIGPRGLADGETDLLATVVDAVPDRGRPVARQVRRQARGRRLQVLAV